jgi:hypothetical protein
MPGLVLRIQNTDTNPAGLNIKGEELSYSEGDSNFIYLLTNMSGSNITITSNTTSITGNVTITGTAHTVTGLITGTITQANNSTTASYIRSTGVDGPHGMNSILSASYAISASYAPNAGGVEGGATNYIPLWTSPNTLSTSSMYQSSTNIGIGTTSPGYKLTVAGTVAFPSLTETNVTDVVMIDVSTGELFRTASTAIAGTYAPGGTNSQIQFNDNGFFGGVPTLTYTGSLLRATGSFTGSFSGSLFGTASWAISASRAISSSYALTSSFSISSSYALSSSFALSASRAVSSSFAFTASQAISSSYSLTASFVKNALTASWITSSGVYGPYGANSILSASYASGSTSASYASSSTSASYALTASYALNTDVSNLQKVTDAGSGSGNDIYVDGVFIKPSGSYPNWVAAIDHTGPGTTIGGKIILREPSSDGNGDTVTIDVTGLSGNKSISIPDGNGYLPLSVNGNFANSAGAITIPTSAGNLSGSGDLNYIAYWSSSTSTLGDSMIYYDDINEYIGIGTSTPSGALSVSGTVYFYDLTEQSQVNFVTYDSASGQLYYFSTASWAYSASQAISSSYAVSSSQAESSSYALTASYVINALTASFITASNVWGPHGSSSVLSASYAVSSSQAESSSYALTASYASNGGVTQITAGTNITIDPINGLGNVIINATSTTFPYSGSAIITGSLLISGSGLTVTGSVYAPDITGSLFGTASWAYSASQAVSSSYAVSASNALTASLALFSVTSSYPMNVTGSTIYSTGPLSIANPNPRGNILIGSGSGNSTVTESVFLGTEAGKNSISASNSILIGYRAGFASNNSSTIGKNNIIIGTNIALSSNRQDSINIGGIIFGTGSYSITTGNPNSTTIVDGKIGINVINPTYNFEVSGNVAFPSLNSINTTNVVTWGTNGQLFYTASSALRPDSASYALSSSQANSASYASAAGGITGGETNYITLWSSPTALTSSIMYQTSNNVGIGTINPTYKLHVVGTGYFDDDVTINQNKKLLLSRNAAGNGLELTGIVDGDISLYVQNTSPNIAATAGIKFGNGLLNVASYIFNASNTSTNYYANSLILDAITGSIELISRKEDIIFSTAASRQPKVVIKQSGNVLITTGSTTDSNYKLFVSSSATSPSGALRIDNVLYVTASNVGINTLPSYNLHASGTISFPSLTVSSQPHFVSYNSSSGQLFYLSTSSFTAATASFVTASNVWGPFGSNSISSASYASGSTSASYAATASYVPTMKGGSASSTSFGGTPLTSSTITFGSAFPNNLYAVTVTGEDARSWTIQNKVSGSFVINSNSTTQLTGPVYWIAVPFNS